MGFSWAHHEFRLGPVPRRNYGLPAVSPTDPAAEPNRIGGPKGPRNDSEQGNAQALLVRKEL
jgi:hypothetical protein